MYDYIFITPLPAFYKINLYREIAKSRKIFVIFIGETTVEKRADDFSGINDINFEYTFLNKGAFQNRNKILSLYSLYNTLKTKKYRKIILGGWDLIESWYVLFTNNFQKNCNALESTVIESKVTGILGLIKKIYLLRLHTVYASGDLHVQLLKKLHYKHNIKITRGVGIINKPTQKDRTKEYTKSFLYIGRLDGVKNLNFLIEIFNLLPNHVLTIVGVGEEKEALLKLASSNIIFLGSIPNKDIHIQFEKHDFLILPSLSETWGLVVEEALYFGLPVIVSKNCGASELIENFKNGFIIDPYDVASTIDIIKCIDNNSYKQLLCNIPKESINIKDLGQVNAYLK